MNKFVTIFITLAMAITMVACGGNKTEKASYTEKELTSDDIKLVSYGYGYILSQNIMKGIDGLDNDLFLYGINQAISGASPTVSIQKIEAALTKFSKDRSQKEQLKQQTTSLKQLEMSTNFLQNNSTKEGVKILKKGKGLQYKVIRAGKGKKPRKNQKVRVHYKGTLIDGTEFDSSYKRGDSVEFALSSVIEGWKLALQNMRVGDKWQLFVPPALAYGDRGVPNVIPANSALIFEVELLAIVK